MGYNWINATAGVLDFQLHCKKRLRIYLFVAPALNFTYARTEM